MLFVLHHPKAADDLTAAQNHLRHTAQHRLVVVLARAQMNHLGALFLAQADRHDLHQTAFDLAVEIRVRLDAVEQQNAVRLMRVAVHVDRVTFRRIPQVNRLHRRADRRADLLFRYAVVFEDRPLPLVGRAAVAAHGGHHERRGPLLLQPIAGRPDCGLETGDAAAADRQGNAFSAEPLGVELRFIKSAMNLGGKILNSGHRRRHALKPVHGRKCDHNNVRL